MTTLTPDQQYEYDERVAICVESGVPQERAEELAKKQVRETPKSPFGRKV